MGISPNGEMLLLLEEKDYSTAVIGERAKTNQVLLAFTIIVVFAVIKCFYVCKVDECVRLTSL